jgi:preflagellin peptidase FlaK
MLLLMILPLVIGASATGITLVYASYRDLQERRVSFRTWYPMLAIGLPMALWTYIAIFSVNIRTFVGILLLSGVFCALFYFAAAYLHLFGGADAWALIFITACIPLFPVVPFFGTPLFEFFPLTVLLNAVLLNLVTPIGIFFWNIHQGNRAPLHYMFVGFPVDGARIEYSYGFVMEEFYEEDGKLSRRFITFRDAIRRMISGERRMYTRDLREHPEEYNQELAHYRKAGSVWISYGVPFLIPITAGFFTALIIGDILYILLNSLAGVGI